MGKAVLSQSTCVSKLLSLLLDQRYMILFAIGFFSITYLSYFVSHLIEIMVVNE